MTSQYEKRKTKIKVEEATSSNPESLAPLYDSVAFDVYFDDSIRKFVRVAIEYNTVTGECRFRDKKDIADSQPVATRKMGELFARKILKIQYE